MEEIKWLVTAPLLICLPIMVGISKAILDLITFKFYSSIFSYMDRGWWDPMESWSNKGDSWIMRTILVFTTDAWHLFDTIKYVSTLAMGSVNFAFFSPGLALIITLIQWIMKGAVFELFYSKLFRL